MKIDNFLIKLILYTFILFSVINSSYAKVLNFNYHANDVSKYFSSIVSFDDFDYVTTEKYLKSLKNFEEYSENYSIKLIHSLVNLGKYNKAYKYSLELNRKNKTNYESQLILGIQAFKKQNFTKAKFHFDKLKPDGGHSIIFQSLKDSLDNWVKIAQSDKRNFDLKKLSSPISNFNQIQKAFANCYLENKNVDKSFENLISQKDTSFSRYNFFYINNLIANNNLDKAKNLVSSASYLYPRNLLINQLKKDLENKKINKNKFSCKKSSDILAEIFYVISNALTSTGNYDLSNFYINLAKYLNPNFPSYNSLLAENYVYIKKYNQAKQMFNKLILIGSVYEWHAKKQITNILEEEGNTEEALNFLTKGYKNINPGIYEIYDFANFLKNQKKYNQSINLYSEILTKINKSHKLYPAVLERRGTAYERIKKWKLAENDLLMSLKIKKNQPYVMNYLAYSWVARGENIDRAISILQEANNLKRNDGYIIDSLGWALYKKNNYTEAKEYLQLAIMLMPRDPVVNDHFGDCLWMNNFKIQARYYWENALKAESAEDELKEKIKNKLLFGLKKT